MQSLIIFALGLAIGSFLNVVILRLPQEEGFVKGRSHCPFCRHVLGWFDLIPLFSFLFLKGRCRYCSKKISWRYFGVELLTALLFLGIFFIYGQNLAPFLLWLAVASLLIVVAFIDFDHLLIPDKILIVLATVALFYKLFNLSSFFNNLLTALVAGLLFLLIFLATSGQKMGLGDVKFVALLGFIFGFPGMLLIFYLAVAGALVWSLILILFFGGKMQTKLPFGSLLAGSAITFILFNKFLIQTFSPYILRLYL